MPQEPCPNEKSGADPDPKTPEGEEFGHPGDTDHPSQDGVGSPPTAAQLVKHLRAWGIFLAALLVGALFQPQIGRLVNSIFPPSAEREILYWTSPMDRSFRSDKPGQDAMGMALVPVYAGAEKEPEPLLIDPVFRQREFITSVVEQGPWVRTVRAIGTVIEAEPLVGEVTLKMDAWVEKLYVDYEGQPVRKGDRLLDVYAPELVTAQDEFLFSLQALEKTAARSSDAARQDAQSILDAAGEKFLYLDVTQSQIDDLAREKKVRKTVAFYSPFDGIVFRKGVFEGTYVKAGSLLYQIVDLSTIWVTMYLDADQSHCVEKGQQATMTLSNLPGYKFSGKLTYIYPDLDLKTRSLRVRLEFSNPDLLLKPGMFTNVVLAPREMGEGLLIPQRAVLRTGTREAVYVSLTDEDSRPTGKFEARSVTTGMRLDGNKVQLLDGLKAGEQVVLSGNFLFDSESRLPSIDRKLLESSEWTEGASRPMRGMDMPEKRGMDMPENGGMDMPENGGTK